jgi:predicted nucleic acid-binding protein
VTKLKEYALDSYALLAFLEGEPGGERVKELFESSRAAKHNLFMCAVNIGEVVYIVERERGLPAAQEILAYIRELPVEIIDAGQTLVLAAAHLKAGTPIAYADCFAAALALDKDAALVTGDPEFRKIKSNELKIEWIA